MSKQITVLLLQNTNSPSPTDITPFTSDIIQNVLISQMKKDKMEAGQTLSLYLPYENECLLDNVTQALKNLEVEYLSPIYISALDVRSQFSKKKPDFITVYNEANRTGATTGSLWVTFESNSEFIAEHVPADNFTFIKIFADSPSPTPAREQVVTNELTEVVE